MAVDTSRASERLRAWNEGDDDALPRGYTHDSLDFQRDLRALLARAEVAEAERDGAKTALVHTCLTLSGVERQRDAALAERDRLAEALAQARREGMEEAARIVESVSEWQGQDYYCDSCKGGAIYPDREDVAAKIRSAAGEGGK